jgi:hypothetical protein
MHEARRRIYISDFVATGRQCKIDKTYKISLSRLFLLLLNAFRRNWKVVLVGCRTRLRLETSGTSDVMYLPYLNAGEFVPRG